MNTKLRNIALAALTASSLTLGATTSHAAPRPCRFGAKGVYVTWAKDSFATGTGTFNTPAGRASVLPGFSWEVTGSPFSIKVATDEPFSGGNSMKGFYGQAEEETNLNIRIDANNTPPKQPIPHSAFLTLRFDAGTPASGWGFAVVDIDVDQVRFSAKDVAGNAVPTSTIAKWFVQKFDANPSTDGVNIPSWDPASAAVVGSESSSTTYRTTVEGYLEDSEAASAWFQPTVSLSELTFEYQSLQDKATPSYHVLLAACDTPFTAPTPTPAASGDSDGDSIPDAVEGSGDGDNDDRPNYLDQDSDGDTVPDSTEGAGDTDGDNIPDYIDEDSDGDDVPDRIERDPDGSDSDPTNIDSDRDGIDDGEESKTDDPIEDKDSDGTPDVRDGDSDNDGKDDGDEAYDLDGDGTRDIDPSGTDSDDDGIDDAFENFENPDQLNPGFIGENSQPRCDKLALTTQKTQVLNRLSDLAARVPKFASRAKACGGSLSPSFLRNASYQTRLLQRELKTSFQNKELRCPVTVCPRSSRSAAKTSLLKYAEKVARYAKDAKLAAIKSCGETPSGKPDNRPQTSDYLAALKKEIYELPASVSDCS